MPSCRSERPRGKRWLACFTSGGFRVDGTLSANDKWTIEGNLSSGREGNPNLQLLSVTSPGPQQVDSEVNLSGGFLQLAWNHTFSARRILPFKFPMMNSSAPTFLMKDDTR